MDRNSLHAFIDFFRRALGKRFQRYDPRAVEPEPALRDEFFSADQMERHGVHLAQHHRLGIGKAKGLLLSRLADNEAVLIKSCRMLTFATRPVYQAHARKTAAWGLSWLQDQQLAGLIMWMPAGLVYTGTMAVLFVARLRDAERKAVATNKAGRRARAILVRRHVYEMGRGEERALFGEAPLACAECLDDIVTEFAKAEKLADLVDGKQLYLYTGGIDGPLMREIGRLRELTFRVVGEGTGTSRDLDTYDSRYEHLVLWDATAQRIAGSYRLGPAGRLISQRGIAGLYTSTLFEFSAELQPQLVHGLELGRSFVAPAYWNSRALNQLWQGIGLYLQRNPQLRYLFGAVSMPITLPREAREWIATAHLEYFGRPGLAEARRPFIISPQVVRHVQQACEGLDSSAGMGKLKQHLDALGVSLPMLYRQYVDLVEPGGVQFLAFGDDPTFSGCVDGLVWLDLATLKPGKRARYLGDRTVESPSGGHGRSLGRETGIQAGGDYVDATDAVDRAVIAS